MLYLFQSRRYYSVFMTLRNSKYILRNICAVSVPYKVTEDNEMLLPFALSLRLSRVQERKERNELKFRGRSRFRYVY